MVTALNTSSAIVSWTRPPHNCLLYNYIVEVTEKENQSVVSLSSTQSTTMNVTTLDIGKTYSFRVASVDAAERMSNWSQPVLLAMQGLLMVCNHKIVSMQISVLSWTCSASISGNCHSYN